MLGLRLQWHRLRCGRTRSKTIFYQIEKAPGQPYAAAAHFATKLRGSESEETHSYKAQRQSASIVFHNGSSTPPGPMPGSPEKVRSIPTSSLALFRDTASPTPKQLAYAHDFFTTHKPSLLFSASRLLTIPFTQIPEVAFLGRSNVGKSSLLNALLRSDICRTSSKPGRTTTMNAFSIGAFGAGKHGLLNVLDMPGYGQGSREEWGKEIIKYLQQRKELKRAFVLVNPAHGLKGTDKQLLQILADERIPHQVVLSKIDRVLFSKGWKPPLHEERLRARLEIVRRTLQEIDGFLRSQPRSGQGFGAALQAFGQVVACAAESGRWRYLGEPRLGALGMDNLRWVVLQAAGLAPSESAVEDRNRQQTPEQDEAVLVRKNVGVRGQISCRP